MGGSSNRLMLGLLLFGGLIVVALLSARVIVDRAARPYVYQDLGAVPACRAGLVLGCARRLSDGRSNLFFAYRMRGAAELFHAGKVSRLIVSGDNHVSSYDEPTDMKRALIEQGVPADHIVCDYAGFSTLDSIVRARDVFGLQELVVISQSFHTRRAVFIARSKGMRAYGYNVQDVGRRDSLKTKLREEFARVKTVLDVWLLNRQPKFLGERIVV